jgi:hypothetical protein
VWVPEIVSSQSDQRIRTFGADTEIGDSDHNQFRQQHLIVRDCVAKPLVNVRGRISGTHTSQDHARSVNATVPVGWSAPEVIGSRQPLSRV